MDVQQAQKQSKQRAQWATCDPFTLVAAAKETLYGEIQQNSNGGSDQIHPLEEVLARFEQLTRASLGTQAPVTS